VFSARKVSGQCKSLKIKETQPGILPGIPPGIIAQIFVLRGC
jgi:hypothetical protein